MNKQKLHNICINELEKLNAKINTHSIGAAAAGTSAALAIKLGAANYEIAAKILDVLLIPAAYAMPVALTTTVLGGILDTYKALLDTKTEERALSIFESVSRTGLSLTAISIALGAFTANPVAIPLIFLTITLNMAAKEIKLLDNTNKKIIELKSTIDVDTQSLNARVTELNSHEDKVNQDPKVRRLAMQIAENQQQLAIQHIQKNNYTKSITALLTVGIGCVTLLLASAIIGNPFSLTALALVATGISLFLGVNKYITYVKTKAHNDILAIQKTPLATQELINKALGKGKAKPTENTAPQEPAKSAIHKFFQSRIKADAEAKSNTATSLKSDKSFKPV